MAYFEVLTASTLPTKFAGENRFHLDYKHPFNALQAFALALSALEL